MSGHVNLICAGRASAIFRGALIEHRGANGQVDRLADLATELVRLDVDLIFSNSQGLAAAYQATSTIPIVSPVILDPVGDGYAISLARPGRNVTGLTTIGTGLVAKRLELLKEMIPASTRVFALRQVGLGELTTSKLGNETNDAARSIGVRVKILDVRTPEEIDAAFFTITNEHADALIVLPGTLLYNERKRLGDLAARHRLPAISTNREFVEVGGLMSYGPNVPDLFSRAGDYVDNILKGAKAGDLPIEQPTKYELLINLKTAKALGVTVPPSLLARADEVIE
jgi:putative ABC transport system substrate-binding protein